MTVFDKLAKLNGWDIIGTAEQTFNREMEGISCPARLIPDELIIDIVLANGIKNYIISQRFDSIEQITSFVYDIINRTIISNAFSDKKTRESFPLLSNFYYYCQKIDRSGTKDAEALKISEKCWYGTMATIRLEEKVSKMFSSEPDNDKFKIACQKIKDIWGYSNVEIDSIRYFVCQAKDRGRTINPSQTKQLYLWSKTKETGKTSVARAIISILNGEDNTNDASKFESTLSRELQYNPHDLPLTAIYNAVILDEAMPNDAKKVYGQIKSMLTSRGCDYNPKYNTTIHVDCLRNYFFTSNNCISDYIKDDSDRRFLTVNPKSKPKQISFDEIYEIWKDFCINATPRLSWAKWYAEFDHIEGLQTKQISEHKDNILNHQYILGELEHMSNYVITLGYFCKKLTNSETPVIDIRRNIKLACIELFGEPVQKGSTWKKSIVMEVLRQRVPLVDENLELIEYEETKGLPF